MHGVQRVVCYMLMHHLAMLTLTSHLLILCDIEFGLGLYESVMVFYPSRCDMTVRGSMLLFEQWLEW
jgi:hypothetical protein